MGRGRRERLRWAGGGEGGEELARARSGKEKGGGRVDKKEWGRKGETGLGQ